jgi:hypothetical protein
MADAATIRQWLNDNGRPQSDHGRISKTDREFYDRAHADLAPPPGDDFAGQGVTAADFPPDDTEPDEPVTPETPPRSGRRARTRTRPADRASRFASRLFDSGGKKKPPGRKPPRVSLEKFVTRGWTMFGRMSMAISQPMGRCLQAQAPMAGILLEDIARGTVTDRFLQPLARAEDKLDKVFALAAPPVLVLAIDMANGLPPAEAAARQAVLVPMLREALRVSMEVSEAYAEAITERLAQNMKYDAQIDTLLAVIFGQAEAKAEPEPEMASS